jgi:4-oxalocrotonate tautomerase
MKGMTDVLVNELGKNPAATWVVLEEVSGEDWGVNGVSVATANKAAAAKSKPVRAAAVKTAPKPAVRTKAGAKAKAKG